MSGALTQDAFDYIVVGAGSAGCVVAARLSEDPECQVCLIEAGGSDRTMFCTKPGMISVVHTVPQVKKKLDWGFYTEPRGATLNRKIPYTRGRVMGGSSAINGMLFVRGNRQNYDDWADEGCEGWGFDDVLPYFKKLESYAPGDDAIRGKSGPVHVTRVDDITPASEAFQAAVSSACNVARLDDYNGPEQEGVGRIQNSAKDGVRYSTSEAYIEPNRGRPNLTVLSGAMARRITFSGSRATGIEVGIGKQVRTLTARQEVVLSGGVIGSAQLLMLSGIGPAAHLAEHGIDVRADLPVGENLHDHLFFPLVYLTPDGINRGTPFYFFSGVLKEKIVGPNWFSRTVFESMAFVKLDASERIPNLQIHSLPWAYPAPNQDAPKRPEVDTRPAITVQPTLIYPESRGEVRLRTANPEDAPHIDPHFLEASADVDFLMRSIELCRDIMNDAAIKGRHQGELEPGAPFSDAAALRKELPNRVCTVYHPVGTCRMGVDERAVVDPSLRVRGIEGLRVADAAIMPSVTGGNTNAPCIMIGEKAADLIRADA